MKYVFNVTKSIKSNLNRYKIIVTKSTVPVTTGDKITKILKSNKNKNKFDVVSNPEFLREGEAIRDFQFPDRVVVGTSSNKANKIMKKLYLPLIKKGGRYFHTSRRSAELIKYASNAFLATKITFINEIANLCEKSNIDVKEVAIGMGLDERIGSRFLRAGPAYGGSCFPKDTRALVSTARVFNTNLSVVKTVINSNDKRTNLLLNKISRIMNNKIKNKNITFLGVTFKPGTDANHGAKSWECCAATWEAAPLGPLITIGQFICPPDIYSVLAHVFIIWSIACNEKLKVINSTTGFNPPNAAPAAKPAPPKGTFYALQKRIKEWSQILHRESALILEELEETTWSAMILLPSNKRRKVTFTAPSMSRKDALQIVKALYGATDVTQSVSYTHLTLPTSDLV